MYLMNGLLRAAQIRPDHVAAICEDSTTGSSSRTWGELHDRVTRLAGALQAIGVTEVSRVAMLALNGIEYQEYYYAVPWLGAVVVPLNTRLAVPELVYELSDSESSVLFFDENLRPQVEKLVAENVSISTYIYIGAGTCPEFALAYEDFLLAGKPTDCIKITPDHILTIMYTGGTTGQPKGVILTHGNMNYNVSCLLYDLNCTANTVLMSNPPLFHLSGLGPLYTIGMCAATCVFLPKFDTAEHLRILYKHKVTQTSLVPTTISWMLDHPDFEAYNFKHLQSIVYGSAPITEALLRRTLEKLPDIKFTQFYGQTEFCGAITILRSEDHLLDDSTSNRLRSAGRPHFTALSKIVNSAGKNLPRGEEGEIVAQGLGTFKGYLNNPEQTAQALQNGWLHTGDVGYLDKDGYLVITDRIKDMIVTGGENVASSEPENAIASHPGVAQVAVIGVPDERWGEKIHAVICQRLDYQLSAGEIIEHCHERLAGYKCPKSIEIRSEDLPLSSIGKIKKDILRHQYEQQRRHNFQGLADIPLTYGSQSPDRIAIDYAGEQITYAELDQRSSQVANALLAENLAPQSRIAILDRNAAVYFDILFGAAKSNLVLVAINFRLAMTEMEFILKDSETEILFVSKDYIDLASDLLDALPRLKKVILLDQENAEYISLNQWLSEAPDNASLCIGKPSDTVLQMYTSGTTGHPKGVELTNKASIIAAEDGVGVWPFLFEEGGSILGVMPLFHIAAANLCLAAMYVGARCVLLRDAGMEEFTDVLVDKKISLVPVPPALIREMLNIPTIKEKDFSSLKVMLIAGSGIAVDLLREAQEAFDCGFAMSYGSTETCGGVTYLRPKDCKYDSGKMLESAGTVLGSAKIKIVDSQGEERALGEVGEIACYIERLFKSYWKRPEATESVIKDSWYYTGDAGYMDEKGYLYVVDRIKDMIVSGGENIYPVEIEGPIHEHPAVSAVAVVGVPDDKWGEAVMAFVITKNNATVTGKEIQNFLRDKIAGYKIPKLFKFVDSFPLNSTGKVLKRELRAPYWEGMSRNVN